MKKIINFIIAVLATVLFPTYISDNSILFSNSIISVIFLVIMYLVISKAEYEKRMFILTHILGFFFSCFVAFGRSLDVYDSVSISKLLFVIIVYAHVWACILNIVWNTLKEVEELMNKWVPDNGLLGKVNRGIAFLLDRPYIIYILLLICWLPCFIADFPGGFRYDARLEIAQIENGYSVNYPMLHSVIITRLLPFCYKFTGTYNTGVTVYVVIQMLLMAAMYTQIISSFWKRKINSLLLAVILMYCSLFPVMQILVVQEVRDVLFSALLTYTFFNLYMMEAEKEEFWNSRIKPIVFGLVVVLTLLARNNNASYVMVALLLVIGVVMWLKYGKQHRKGVLLYSASSIGLYIVIGKLLVLMCQPMLVTANLAGALSLMSQPLARVYYYEQDSLSSGDIERINGFMNLDNLEYYPENADTTKSQLRITDDFGEFIAFWSEIGRRYPGTYVDAILANTQNVWYPDSVIDGYNQRYKNEEGTPFYGYEKCYFDISPELQVPVVHDNLWPAGMNYYTQIGRMISFEKIPIVSMLFSIGFMFWFVLNCLFYNIYRKNYKLLVPVIALLTYMLISACVPLILLRYFAAVFFAMPFLIAFTLQPDRCCNMK